MTTHAPDAARNVFPGTPAAIGSVQLRPTHKQTIAAQAILEPAIFSDGEIDLNESRAVGVLIRLCPPSVPDGVARKLTHKQRIALDASQANGRHAVWLGNSGWIYRGLCRSVLIVRISNKIA